MEWPDMPDEITDRDADCWEPLLAVADAAGGEWPARARCAGVTLVTDAKAAPPSIGIRLLADLQTIFDEASSEHLFTDDILSALVAMELAPWGDIRGKALDARSLSRRLNKYSISPRTVRSGDKTAKGYARADLADAWSRYVSAPDYEGSEFPMYLVGDKGMGQAGNGSVTSVTPSQSSFAGGEF
jgi:hypothetical protein